MASWKDKINTPRGDGRAVVLGGTVLLGHVVDFCEHPTERMLSENRDAEPGLCMESPVHEYRISVFPLHGAWEAEPGRGCCLSCLRPA